VAANLDEVLEESRVFSQGDRRRQLRPDLDRTQAEGERHHPLGYEQYYRRFARRVPPTTAPLSCTVH
jgi:hypothetical protein